MREPSANPPEGVRAHPLEWALAGLEGVLLLLLAVRAFLPEFLEGELLPCAAAALAPGTLARLAGVRAWPFHRVGVAAGLVIFLLTNNEVDLTPLSRMEIAWVPAALGFGVLLPVVPAAGALRWRRLLAAQGIDLALSDALRLVLVGHFFNTFVPGAVGGDLVRAYAVARDRRRPDQAVTSVLLDRLLGLPMQLLFLLAGCALNIGWLGENGMLAPYAGGVVFLATVTAGLLVVLVFRGGSAEPVPQEIAGAGEASGGVRGRLVRTIRAARRDRAANAAAMLWSLPGHAATIAAAVLFARAVGSEIPLTRLLLLVPLGVAANAVPVAPGGVGQGEGAFYALFSAASSASAAGAQGLVVMLGLRAGLLAFAFAGGVLYAAGRDRAFRPAEGYRASAPPVALDAAASPGKESA